MGNSSRPEREDGMPEGLLPRSGSRLSRTGSAVAGHPFTYGAVRLARPRFVFGQQGVVSNLLLAPDSSLLNLSCFFRRAVR